MQNILQGNGSLLNGTYASLSPNNHKQTTAYKNGKKHGFSRSYYKNGQIENFEMWVRGKLHGASTCWYEGGTKRSEGHHNSNAQTGIQTEWYESGRKFKESYLLPCSLPENIISLQWYESGGKKSEVSFSRDLKVRKFTGWHENGQKSSEHFLSDGQKHGIDAKWDEEGKMLESTLYSQGAPVSQTPAQPDRSQPPITK